MNLLKLNKSVVGVQLYKRSEKLEKDQKGMERKRVFHGVFLLVNWCLTLSLLGEQIILR